MVSSFQRLHSESEGTEPHSPMALQRRLTPWQNVARKMSRCVSTNLTCCPPRRERMLHAALAARQAGRQGRSTLFFTFGLAIAKTNFSALFFPTPGSLCWLVTTMKSSRQPPNVMTDWYGWESSVFWNEGRILYRWDKFRQECAQNRQIQHSLFVVLVVVWTDFVVWCCGNRDQDMTKSIRIPTRPKHDDYLFFISLDQFKDLSWDFW